MQKSLPPAAVIATILAAVVLISLYVWQQTVPQEIILKHPRPLMDPALMQPKSKQKNQIQN